MSEEQEPIADKPPEDRSDNLQPTIGVSRFELKSVTVRLIEFFSNPDMRPGDLATHAEICNAAQTSKDAWQSTMGTVVDHVLEKTGKVILAEYGIGYKIANDDDLARLGEKTRKSVHKKAVRGHRRASMADPSKLSPDQRRRNEADIQTLALTILATSPRTIKALMSSKLSNKPLDQAQVIAQLSKPAK